ncbi:MAG: MarR family transcriptional regulator [Gemmatimonadetes bacterium]|nr:MarR family transcriptional regulator [Gemmatimonadota bacterium]
MPRTSRIQQELRQQRPFGSTAQEATIALLRTADLVRRRIADSIEGHGVTLQQYNVLRILRGAGGPLPTLEIATRMIEQAPGITRLVDRMEAKGWVSRTTPAHDRRCVHVALTPAGAALLATLDPIVNANDVAALGPLSPAQAEHLIALLDAIRGETG